MAAMPSKIWIRTQGKDAPDWVMSYMATGTIDADGSFEVATPDGPIKVNVGDALFVFNEEAYVSPPKLLQDKLRLLAPEEAAAAAKPQPKKPQTKAKPRFKPTIGSPCAPQFARISDLLVDDTYQRSIEGGASQKIIQKMAAEWDWRLCLPLLVSRRDGKLYVIDGQHRKEAADMRGDIEQMPIVVFDLDDPKAEAELFVKANRARRPMSKLDDFHAALVSEDKESIAIAEVVESAGLKVGRHGAWQMMRENEVVFVSTIKRALKTHGREICGLAMQTIAAAFPNQVLTGGGAIFEGLCTLISDSEKGGPAIDLDLMGIVLTEVGLPGWKVEIEGAESGFDRRDAMTTAMRRAYNEAGAE